jgi:hypothetical protein
MATIKSAPVLEENEAPVEEVLCSVTHLPITSLPAWYANVKVRFVSEQGRARNNRLEYAIPDEDVELETEETLPEGYDDDIEIDEEPDEAESEIDDTEIEAELDAEDATISA